MKASRIWQTIIILMLTVMISLNLRILFSTQDPEEWGALQECQQIIRTSADVVPINASQAWFKWTELGPNQTRVIGHMRRKKGFVTIGIPSIKRENGMTYLIQTISSLAERTNVREKTEVVVMVFLADFDQEYNKLAIKAITDKFMDHINTGFLQIVQASRNFYPQLTHLKQNFKDTSERVRWRAKQVSDFSFMFLYAHNLSKFYLQLEDDVIAAPNFVASIKDFTKHQRLNWAVLEFSELGFIGKMFKSENLRKLAQFMMTFYDEQPIDWLIRYYREAMAQTRQILRKPTLFQHVGLTSSFDTSKLNKLRDRYFDSGEKRWKGDDPAATVATNMKPYDTYTPDLAYGSGSGYFWARDAKQGDALYIIFENDEKLKRVVVETGHEKHQNDIVKSGILEVSPKLLKMDGFKVTCADWKTLGEFQHGRIDADDLDKTLAGRTTKCLKVTITEDQSEWVLIHQVAVFLRK